MWNCARLFPGTGNSSFRMPYAIIKSGGRQHRVMEGEVVDLDLLDGEVGKIITLTHVLLHADKEKVTHGSPIENATVTAEVVEHRKDKKVIAFKYRRRKGYHRTVGHRRKLTRVRIKSISLGGSKAKKSE